jgi:hypothetical protein
MNAEPKKRWSKVELPADTVPPFNVFVNGIRQVEGEDYELEDHTLYFFRPIRKEQKLGIFRWTVLFFGIAGSYKQNDSVDVHGRRGHHVNLPIVQLEIPTDEERGMLLGSYSPGG